MHTVKIENINIGDNSQLTYIGGPCVIESEDSTLKHAEKLKTITDKLNIQFVFKSSYDKANRLSLKSYRGPGISTGLKILKKVKEQFSIPILTDIHSPEEAKIAAEVIDILQIPAFLCRQTDLIVSAAKTGKAINIKKGQFLPASDMQYLIQKATSENNMNIILTERGSTFGQGPLINDMKSIPIMKAFGFPVIFDAGHSVQIPGGLNGQSGGMREMISILAKAGIAAGANGLFIETHENPDKALSDGPNMIKLSDLYDLLLVCKEIHKIIFKEAYNVVSKI